MIDLHVHILPGIDDGARSLEDARMLARKAALDGVTTIAATPHVRLDFPTHADEMEAAVEALRADFSEQFIPVQLLHGGEIALDLLWEIGAEDLVRFTIAQTGRYLLLEFPYRGPPHAAKIAVRNLRATGITAILAHPERNPVVQDHPTELDSLVEAGALVQVTASSLDPSVDKASEHAARALLELGLVHVVATDAHGPHIPRDVSLAAAVEILDDPGLAHYLTEEAPAAIAAGERLPSGPPLRGRLA